VLPVADDEGAFLRRIVGADRAAGVMDLARPVGDDAGDLGVAADPPGGFAGDRAVPFEQRGRCAGGVFEPSRV